MRTEHLPIYSFFPIICNRPLCCSSYMGLPSQASFLLSQLCPFTLRCWKLKRSNQIETGHKQDFKNTRKFEGAHRKTELVSGRTRLWGQELWTRLKACDKEIAPEKLSREAVDDSIPELFKARLNGMLCYFSKPRIPEDNRRMQNQSL